MPGGVENAKNSFAFYAPSAFQFPPIIMFTGIVEEAGRVVAFTQNAAAWRLQIAASSTLAGTALGDSIAVNGCCLTVVERDAQHFFFDEIGRAHV